MITVSRLDEKFHPLKVLTMQHQTIGYFDSRGGQIIRRQQLDSLYFRNGICYAVSRECLLARAASSRSKRWGW